MNFIRLFLRPVKLHLLLLLDNYMRLKLLPAFLLAALSVTLLSLFLYAKSSENGLKHEFSEEEEESEMDATVDCGGVERWAVKVFTDPLASTIDWTPKSTTIAHLVAITTPKPGTTMPRYQPVEDSTYIFNCRITIKKAEGDDDIHLVLSDGVNTIIGEIPDPACPSVATSPKAAQFTIARDWVLKNIGKGNVNTINIPPVTITGVAFIDPPHGQTGAAPNNLEIHSIIDIHFTVFTGVNELMQKEGSIKIYPNPFSSETAFSTEIDLKNATLTVYNSFGQQVKQMNNISGHSFTFQRDNLPAGLYIIRLSQDKKIVATERVVIGL